MRTLCHVSAENIRQLESLRKIAHYEVRVKIGIGNEQGHNWKV